MPNHSEGDDRLGMYELQNLDYDTTVVVDPIVINDWYVALPPTRNVKAYYLIVEQTNNGATNETLVVELTINGVPHTATFGAAVSGAPYYYYLDADSILNIVVVPRQMITLDADHSAPLETHNLGIRVRQTTAVDLVAAQIEVNLVYATKERTP